MKGKFEEVVDGPNKNRDVIDQFYLTVHNFVSQNYDILYEMNVQRENILSESLLKLFNRAKRDVIEANNRLHPLFQKPTKGTYNYVDLAFNVFFSFFMVGIFSKL